MELIRPIDDTGRVFCYRNQHITYGIRTSYSVSNTILWIPKQTVYACQIISFLCTTETFSVLYNQINFFNFYGKSKYSRKHIMFEIQNLKKQNKPCWIHFCSQGFKGKK